MNEDQLNEMINNTEYPRVFKSDIEKKIKKVDYIILPNTTVTICNITLENGFSVRGESACIDERNFNMKIGQEIAYRNAFNQIWDLEGYLLKEKIFQGEA